MFPRDQNKLVIKMGNQNSPAIVVDIETKQLQTRKKKNGGTYEVQAAYVHLLDRNGNPERYPREIAVFPQRDASGNSIAYEPGQYVIDPRSFRDNNGYLELAFLILVPIQKQK